MSAFIVEKITIDRAITLLVQKNLCLKADATLRGWQLWHMNIDAVMHRYSHLADEDGEEWAVARSDAETYVWEPQRDSLEQLHKALCCVLYQCSEGDVPERELFKFLDAVSKMPELKALEETGAWVRALWG